MSTPAMRLQPAPRSDSLLMLAGFAALGGYALLVLWALGSTSSDVMSVMLLPPFLVLISLPIIKRATQRDLLPLTGLCIAGLLLKLAGTVPRYYVSTQVYERTDASRYHEAGAAIAASFWSGRLSIWQLVPTGRSTRFIEQLTGLLYTFTGPSKLGAYVFFSWLGFWGLFLLHRALVVGFPEADQRRYALLLFLLPTHLFWPSSIGKDAWMLLTIGVVAYGVASFLAGRFRGLLYLALGAGLASIVRPHVALIAFLALVVAYLVRRSPEGRDPVFGLVARLVVSLVLVAGLLLLVARVSAMIEVRPKEGQTRFDALVTEVQRRTTQGGSAVDTGDSDTIPGRFVGAFTVLFRPTLFEARSLTTAISAVETTFLLGLFAVSWRRVLASWRWFRRRPYLLFGVLYTIGFSFAFSTIGNLGILARQRAQVLPFLLLLVVVPKPGEEPAIEPVSEPEQPTWTVGPRR